MYLDSRSYMIFQEIVDNSSATGKGLEEKFHLTRKQLSYSFDKINDYLRENGHPEIKRLKTGYFMVPGPVAEHYSAKEAAITKSSYTYSDEERAYWIELRLLCHEDELSTYHFTEELQISKNTLLSDLKKVQERVNRFSLELAYNRKEGYRLYGSEYHKRELLTHALRKLLNMPGGEENLNRIYGIREEGVKNLRENIEEIENKLQLQFTDERLKELLYIFYFTLIRIKNEKTVEAMDQYRLVTTTKEYSVVAAFADKYRIKDENEIVYFAVQIQISKVHNRVYEDMGNLELLRDAGMHMLERFESISCVRLDGRTEFLEILYQHMKPAVYRIWYGYHVEPDITDMILPKYQYLHEIVRKAVRPYEVYLTCTFPDPELVYITVLFASWLHKEGKLIQVQEKERAVVVCTNGLTVSQYLFVSLSELLPEIEFLECLSLRDFYEYDKDFQIVFSTVRLETDKEQFVVYPFANDIAKKSFREKVLDNIRVSEGEVKLQSRLPFLLPDERIQITREMPDWQNAIRMASAPLLENGFIDRNYVERAIDMVETDKRFIMIADGVIIAHAGVDDGVYSMGMSFLRLPEKLSFNGYMDADIIVVLATPDKTRHLPALYQLFDLLEDEGNISAMRRAQDAHEIARLIRKYI